MSEVLAVHLTAQQQAIVDRLRKLEERIPRDKFADIPQYVILEWHFARLNEERAKNHVG